ncbi:hypothetical protein Tcan_01030, partial [Toxocara canis]
TGAREQSILQQIAIFERKAADAAPSALSSHDPETSNMQTNVVRHLITTPTKSEQTTKGEICKDGYEISTSVRKEEEAKIKARKRIEELAMQRSGIAQDFDTIIHVPDAQLEGIDSSTHHDMPKKDIEKYSFVATVGKTDEKEHIEKHSPQSENAGGTTKEEEEGDYTTPIRYPKINDERPTDKHFTKHRKIYEEQKIPYGRTSADDRGTTETTQQNYEDISQVPEEDILRVTQTKTITVFAPMTKDNQYEIGQEERTSSERNEQTAEQLPTGPAAPKQQKSPEEKPRKAQFEERRED